MIKKVLATLDGSKTSESVIPYVEMLLGSVDATVTLATVVPWPEEAEPQRTYLSLVAGRLEEKGARVDYTILSGEPAAEIVKHAVEGGYDLVMLCTRSTTSLQRTLFGSVAEEILRRSPVPVLVVHPLEGSARPLPIRNIVVPLDGSHRSASVLPTTAEIARLQGAKLSFLTVVSTGHPNDLPVDVISANLIRDQKELGKQGIETELTILYGDPVQETLAFAESQKAGLLAISTHGRAGLDRLLYGSVAESLLRRSKLPMLVLRTAAIPKEYALHHRALEARHHAYNFMRESGTEPAKGPYSSR